jgi:plasmid maintenance system antidote protein VapI
MGDLNDRHADHPGSFIEEMLEDRGWTQVDLARVLGWDASQLDKLIKGETDVTLDAVVSLGNAFNLPAEFFMDMRQVHVTDEENDGRHLAERLPDIKKQIESFILDGTTKALASSRIMDPIRRRELLIQNHLFASEMNSLDKSSTINHAKFHAFQAIDNAFITGVLIGKSIPDEVVTKILSAARVAQTKNALEARETELQEERSKRIAAFVIAKAKHRNWDRVCTEVNKILGSEVYKDGKSARVSCYKLTKTEAKKRNDWRSLQKNETKT